VDAGGVSGAGVPVGTFGFVGPRPTVFSVTVSPGTAVSPGKQEILDLPVVEDRVTLPVSQGAYGCSVMLNGRELVPLTPEVTTRLVGPHASSTGTWMIKFATPNERALSRTGAANPPTCTFNRSK
jgi:hypothetical protein